MTSLAATTLLLALAWFTVVNVAGSLASWLVGQVMYRREWSPAAGALLALRLFPSAASLSMGFVLFVPSHWLMEPRDAKESPGLLLYVAAAAGLFLISRGMWRAAALGLADWRLRSRERRLPTVPGLREADGLPGLALAGLVRTRILVGPRVLTELSAAELEVAIAHELAHRRAFDNLKRWAVHCAPDFFGASAVAVHVEHEWHAAAESRADARAVGQDSARAVNLATALIKVARLTSHVPPFGATPVWSTLNDSALLRARVQTLTSDLLPTPARRPARAAGMAVLFVSAAILAAPALGRTVHRITETAVALLP